MKFLFCGNFLLCSYHLLISLISINLASYLLDFSKKWLSVDLLILAIAPFKINFCFYYFLHPSLWKFCYYLSSLLGCVHESLIFNISFFLSGFVSFSNLMYPTSWICIFFSLSFSSKNILILIFIWSFLPKVFWHLLKLALWPSAGSIFTSIFYVIEKSIYSSIVLCVYSISSLFICFHIFYTLINFFFLCYLPTVITRLKFFWLLNYLFVILQFFFFLDFENTLFMQFLCSIKICLITFIMFKNFDLIFSSYLAVSIWPVCICWVFPSSCAWFLNDWHFTTYFDYVRH